MIDTKIDTSYGPTFKSSVEEIREINKSTNVELEEEGVSLFSNNSSGSSGVNHKKEIIVRHNKKLPLKREKNVKQIPS